VTASEGSGSVAPAFAWREQVQNRIRALLAASPLADPSITVERWRAVKEEWRRFVNKTARALIERDRAPLTVRLVGRHAGAGFRIENLVFESFPGWQVGLNLFLPEGAGPFIPVLCPCGHGPKWASEHQVPPQVLARHGFAAALFDMPMFGEKPRNNYHFIQGPQAEMVGRWSNEFFLLDALRTADYLETRSDITFVHGMGVTGVSGGGMASQFLASIDPRVRALVPVCSVARRRTACWMWCAVTWRGSAASASPLSRTRNWPTSCGWRPRKKPRSISPTSPPPRRGDIPGCDIASCTRPTVSRYP